MVIDSKGNLHAVPDADGRIPLTSEEIKEIAAWAADDAIRRICASLGAGEVVCMSRRDWDAIRHGRYDEPNVEVVDLVRP